MRVACLVENRNHVTLTGQLSGRLRGLGLDPYVVAVKAHEQIDYPAFINGADAPAYVLDHPSEPIAALAAARPRRDRHLMAAGLIRTALECSLPRPQISVLFNDASRTAREFATVSRSLGASTCVIQDGFVHFDRIERLGLGVTRGRRPSLLDAGFLSTVPDAALVWGPATVDVALDVARDRDRDTAARVVGSPSPVPVLAPAPVTGPPWNVLVIDQCFVRYDQMTMAAWTEMMRRWVEALASDPDRVVSIRLHPSQTEPCRDWLIDLIGRRPNISLAREQSLVEALAEADVVAGFYSTVLLEALTAGANVLVLDDAALPMYLPLMDEPRLRRTEAPDDLRGSGPVTDVGARSTGAPPLSHFVASHPWADRTAESIRDLAYGLIRDDPTGDGWRVLRSSLAG